MTFIKEYFLDDLSICDELINLYKNNDKKAQGHSGGIIQPNVKKSTDISLSPYDVNISNIDFIRKYFINLQKITSEYIKEYHFCNEANPWGIVENYNIQHYKPNEGYFAWHFERGDNVMPANNRHLTWMTYLNNLTDEGGTEFYYQKLKVEPKKGKTVIFPCDWTHTHKGVVSQTQDKYIITGWFNFTDKK